MSSVPVKRPLIPADSAILVIQDFASASPAMLLTVNSIYRRPFGGAHRRRMSPRQIAANAGSVGCFLQKTRKRLRWQVLR